MQRLIKIAITVGKLLLLLFTTMGTAEASTTKETIRIKMPDGIHLSTAAYLPEEGGRIAVRCGRDGDHCRIRVTDTGMGIVEGPAGDGFGLASVRERLTLHYGEDHRFTITSDEGVTVTILLPMCKGMGEKMPP